MTDRDIAIARAALEAAREAIEDTGIGISDPLVWAKADDALRAIDPAGVKVEATRSEFYCEAEGEPPCAGVVALRAKVAELEAAIRDLRMAALVEDWYTFDATVANAMREGKG